MTAFTFIVGCARSGTSILGELVASHPRVDYIFEASPIWEWGGMGENESHRLLAEHATPELKRRIRRWFKSRAHFARTLVEKNPRNILRIPYMKEIFPEARILHIVRDGRDVACSMIPGCGLDHWSHLKPPSWKEYFENYSGAVRCAMAWNQSLEIGLKDLAEVSHLQVRYEDLLASPESVAGEIFAYMGMNMYPKVSEFCQKVSNQTASSYHAMHQDQWYRDDHQVRVGRWRENLAPAEQERINALLAPMLTHLGYPLN